MKLSVRGEYALRALIALGREQQERRGLLSVQEIASAQNIPKRFLEQILGDLRNAGVVESRRGVAGGFQLRRPAADFTLADLIRVLEGPLAPVSCVSERFYEKCSCPSEERCALRSIMREVRNAITGILEHTTLAALCERARDLDRRSSDSVEYMI